MITDIILRTIRLDKTPHCIRNLCLSGGLSAVVEITPPEFRRVIINSEYIRELSDALLHRALGSRFAIFIKPSIQRASYIKRAQILLGRIYQVSWFLLP